ncbi:phage baseplate assembly protein [Magnetospirillum molischianum]|uniref:Putative Phage tail protein n=1 Tax=Magnetospirillum molischianum DSM 120 TaxID=1150626 RepID=H8FV02_MAGML|nr:contractile injection system protein, VgrG/Pvc8 family [Magnetospirillum molischianum]CCG42190.1 putative Phage tail protein [Magnetospirillum molischianum DSM 120]
MPAPSDTVRLEVGGELFGGWLSVGISAGLDRAARDFSLGVTDRWPGEGVALVSRRVKAGDLCRLWIGDDLVLTGFVDATPIEYDDKEITLSVRGRSKTADLVDCAALSSPGQWTNRRVEQIAADLAKVYGVSVVTAVDTGAVVSDHQIQPGETVMGSIDRLLTLRQLLATDDAQGRLVLCRAGSARAGGALVVGDNILTGSADLDWTDRFKHYIVRGQSAGSDLSFGAAVAGLEGSATDKAVGRNRVMVLSADGNGDTQSCRQTALWEAAHRAAKSYETSYTVQGWRAADGRLWQPGQMVRVKDPIIGFDLDLLIGEVIYSLTEADGTRATLLVAPKAAWELAPQVPEAGLSGQAKGAEMVTFAAPSHQASSASKPTIVKF